MKYLTITLACALVGINAENDFYQDNFEDYVHPEANFPHEIRHIDEHGNIYFFKDGYDRGHTHMHHEDEFNSIDDLPEHEQDALI